MLEVVVAILLLFALFAAFVFGKRYGSAENYMLRKDNQRLEVSIARERAIRRVMDKVLEGPADGN